jgi:hypothetical protein
MSSYIYPTVFVRNAANLTQFLPKASKIRNRNESLKRIFLACLVAFKKNFLETFSAYTALIIKNNFLATSVKLVGPFKQQLLLQTFFFKLKK